MVKAILFKEQIHNAIKSKRSLRIRGHGSKDFYGQVLQGDLLDTSCYSGIIDYEPSELVITACAGTPLKDIEATLFQYNQMLAFEPPFLGGQGTLGGAIASGLSGPRRPYAGAARDFVLGIRMLDGYGNDLSFGGQVIKNVAGFDLSRLQVGALGTLGLLLDISLKVLPRPQAELSLRFEMSEKQSIEKANEWATKGLPLSATCFLEGLFTIRLSGAESVIQQKHRELGGESISNAKTFWDSIRNQTADFYTNAKILWRVSVPSMAPSLDVNYPQLIEWGGALRWINGDIDTSILRSKVESLGGHVTLFRSANKETGVFHPLKNNSAKIHQKIKHQFDPHRIFNINRLYPNF